MARLLLGNVENEATDEEIREFLKKYGFPAFEGIERVPGSGERPSVIVNFGDVDAAEINKLQPRIQDLFWHNRTINAQVLFEPYR
ncbi:MAG TPA: RNA-binding protein [Burkholderiaceae bacterium]|jgi:hypothetical protein|nr:RNA-binding protein [Burkholderiaceae bacterium]